MKSILVTGASSGIGVNINNTNDNAVHNYSRDKLVEILGNHIKDWSVKNN